MVLSGNETVLSSRWDPGFKSPLSASSGRRPSHSQSYRPLLLVVILRIDRGLDDLSSRDFRSTDHETVTPVMQRVKTSILPTFTHCGFVKI